MNAPRLARYELDAELARRPREGVQLGPPRLGQRGEQRAVRRQGLLVDPVPDVGGGSRELEQLGHQRLALPAQQRGPPVDLIEAPA